jgi:hypothetical protein
MWRLFVRAGSRKRGRERGSRRCPDEEFRDGETSDRDHERPRLNVLAPPRRHRRPPRAASALPSSDATSRKAGRGSPSVGRRRGQDLPPPPASRRHAPPAHPHVLVVGPEAEEARRAEEPGREHGCRRCSTSERRRGRGIASAAASP